jgi:hypothetical protein
MRKQATLSLPSQPVGGISVKSTYDRHGFVLFVVNLWRKSKKTREYAVRSLEVRFPRRFGSILGLVPLEVRFYLRNSPIEGWVPLKVGFH